MFKLVLEKAEEPQIKLQTSARSSKKQENSRKTSTSAWLVSREDPLEKEMAIHSSTIAWKIPWTEELAGYSLWGRKETDVTERLHFQHNYSKRTWETCMQVKKQQLELNMKQHTGFKSGKEFIKAVYCHCAYLTYMQNTSWETLGWMKHSWNKDCWEKYQ